MMAIDTSTDLSRPPTRSHRRDREPTVTRRDDRHDQTGAVLFTWEGRRILAAKFSHLRDEVIPDLLVRQQSENPGAVDYLDDEYQRAVEKLAHVCWVLAQARPVESTPDDPRVVELGEAVTLFLEDGTLERRLIVHPLEAPFGGLRVSSDSPLGQALLGRRIGDEVEVRAPTGPYRCRIIRAERLDGAKYLKWDPAVPESAEPVRTPRSHDQATNRPKHLRSI